MKTLLLLFVMAAPFALRAQDTKIFTRSHGAIVRGDSTRRELSLVFTADETGEGLPVILQTLKEEGVKAGFFFTGRFYRNPLFQRSVLRAGSDGHYLGPHSDQHLLYCDWNVRDSLLVTQLHFERDLLQNKLAMLRLRLMTDTPQFFIPPYEWWNDSIAAWSRKAGYKLFNFTPGLRTNTDYTWPEMGATYKSSDWIMAWLKDFIQAKPNGLNGAILLLHAGTDPRRKDKFYKRLKEMIGLLKAGRYSFVRVDDLLQDGMR